METLHIIETSFLKMVYIIIEYKHAKDYYMVIKLKRVPDNINELETIINFVEWDILYKKDLGEIKVLNSYLYEFNLETSKYENGN